jgi:p21-activated kinase 5
MFSKKKKKPEISLPSNFEHRVHTGFDKKEGKYIGLPLQWQSVVGNNQILKSSNRPVPVSSLFNSCIIIISNSPNHAYSSL